MSQPLWNRKSGGNRFKGLIALQVLSPIDRLVQRRRFCICKRFPEQMPGIDKRPVNHARLGFKDRPHTAVTDLTGHAGGQTNSRHNDILANLVRHA